MRLSLVFAALGAVPALAGLIGPRPCAKGSVGYERENDKTNDKDCSDNVKAQRPSPDDEDCKSVQPSGSDRSGKSQSYWRQKLQTFEKLYIELSGDDDKEAKKDTPEKVEPEESANDKPSKEVDEVDEDSIRNRYNPCKSGKCGKGCKPDDDDDDKDKPEKHDEDKPRVIESFSELRAALRRVRFESPEKIQARGNFTRSKGSKKFPECELTVPVTCKKLKQLSTKVDDLYKSLDAIDRGTEKLCTKKLLKLAKEIASEFSYLDSMIEESRSNKSFTSRDERRLLRCQIGFFESSIPMLKLIDKFAEKSEASKDSQRELACRTPCTKPITEMMKKEGTPNGNTPGSVREAFDLFPFAPETTGEALPQA